MHTPSPDRSPYTRLEWADVDKTSIRAFRSESDVALIDQTVKELWEIITSGVLGEIQSYQAPPEPSHEYLILGTKAKIDQLTMKVMERILPPALARVYELKRAGGALDMSETAIRGMSKAEFGDIVNSASNRCDSTLMRLDHLRIESKLKTEKTTNRDQLDAIFSEMRDHAFEIERDHNLGVMK